jgi:hypothetical protein
MNSPKVTSESARVTDCLGDGGYQVGKQHLVYAAEGQVKDVHFRKDPRCSSPDIACKPGGELAQARAELKELGPGRVPAHSRLSRSCPLESRLRPGLAAPLLMLRIVYCAIRIDPVKALRAE